MHWDEARQGGLRTARPAFFCSTRRSEWRKLASIRRPRREREHSCRTSRETLSLLTQLIVASLLGGLLSCLAEAKELQPRAAPGPKIQFSSTEYDFGKVEAGVVVKHGFVFTNIGTATLEIGDVRPGCGCTTAGTWTRRVKPGKTGIIPLEFNSGNFSGAVSKQATVICNVPGQTNVALEIKGTVWKPIDISASMIAFILSSESARNETKTVRIVSNLDEQLKLSDPQCTNEFLKAELKTVKEGKEFELQITAARPSAYSSIAAPISVKTSSAKMPTIEVIAYVMLQQPVTVIPPQILLLPGSVSNAVREVVTVRYTGTNAFALSDATVNAPGATVRTQETEPGRSFNLTVDFPPGFQVEPNQKVELTVKSNHPQFPLIRVPVFVPQPGPNLVAEPGVTPIARTAPGERPSPAVPGK